MTTRTASHAGSWYSNDASKLRAELDKNLAAVKPLSELKYDPPVINSKAIIGPHAGFAYSGPAAAWAYAAIPTDKIKRVVLLGPSHHFYLDSVAISQHFKFATPLGDIPLDLEALDKLGHTGLFDSLDRDADDEEHSLELHLPYIRHIFQKNPDLKLVPLLVGSVSPPKVEQLAPVLAELWNDPETFFVISSDFCHWGKRFQYTPYYPAPPSIGNPVPPVTSPLTSSDAKPEKPQLLHLSRDKPEIKTPIWESTQYLDHQAIEILRRAGEKGTQAAFREYLKQTKNTICGRNPIFVLLGIMEYVQAKENKHYEAMFVRYEQSSRVMNADDSSVSYVSGVYVQK